MSNNRVKDMAEFEKLVELPCLEELHFVGNPLEDRYSLIHSFIRSNFVI